MSFSSVPDWVELHVPDWVQTGMDSGELYLQGGVVRHTVGRKTIAYWLKAGDVVFKQSIGLAGTLLPTVVSALGFGLMQVNFLVVFKKLNTITRKLDDLANDVAKVTSRIDVSMFGKARAGCQLAHEALLMPDQTVAKMQLVQAKSLLLEADTYFSDLLFRADPLTVEFADLCRLVAHVRVAYARACAWLGDPRTAALRLNDFTAFTETVARRCLDAPLPHHADNSTRRLFDQKYDTINELLASGECAVRLREEAQALIENGSIPRYSYFES